MAPKVNAQPAKLAQILAWFQNSGVAHSIKDLEKALPSVASINGMHVKDYLQALSDENQIKVEKIGSGNWYWSFDGEERVNVEKTLEKVIEENEKASAAVKDLRSKVVEAEAARANDNEARPGEELMSCRKEMSEKKEALEGELLSLRLELAGYSDRDPVEVQMKRAEMLRLRRQAEKCTEQCMEMERWLREKMGMDRERLLEVKKDVYGDQFNEDEEGLMEL